MGTRRIRRTERSGNVSGHVNGYEKRTCMHGCFPCMTCDKFLSMVFRWEETAAAVLAFGVFRQSPTPNTFWNFLD